MRWQLIIEEYRSDIKYIPCPEDIIADTLSQLLMVNTDNDVHKLYDKNIEKKNKCVYVRTSYRISVNWTYDS